MNHDYVTLTMVQVLQLKVKVKGQNNYEAKANIWDQLIN